MRLTRFRLCILCAALAALRLARAIRAGSPCGG